MNKTKISLLSLVLLSVFLILPLVQAAQPQVWFNEDTELIWEYTEEGLDETYSVDNSSTYFRKFNFTEIVTGGDHLNVSGKFHTATEEDITTYGFENQTIWESSMSTMHIDPILDYDLSTKYVSLFNELNVDLNEISTLPSNNQTYALMRMSVLVDPSFFSAYLVYALIQKYGSFIDEMNGSEIIDVSDRQILFILLLDYSFDDDGHESSLTYIGNMNLTYGVTSNVLLKSVCNSTLVATGWNEDTLEYETTTARIRYTHEIAYPTELLDDYPEGELETTIPGYQIWIFLGAITLAVIPLYLVAKRKK